MCFYKLLAKMSTKLLSNTSSYCADELTTDRSDLRYSIKAVFGKCKSFYREYRSGIECLLKI